MTPLRQFAMAATGCAFMMIGMVGCMPERPASISPDAAMETSGDKTLTWTASADGRVTVWDQNADKIVYGSKVRTGQSVFVDVDRNRIMLDNQVVNENSLHSGDQYRIFFEARTGAE